MIEESQVVVHEGDEPDFIAHLLDADRWQPEVSTASCPALVAAPAAVADQAVPIQHGVYRADRGGLGVRVPPSQLLANPWCAPTGVVALDLQDQPFDMKRQPVGVPIGSAAAVVQALDAAILVALRSCSRSDGKYRIHDTAIGLHTPRQAHG